jgi:hypothetical protein
MRQLSKNEQTEMNIDSESATQLGRSAIFLGGPRPKPQAWEMSTAAGNRPVGQVGLRINANAVLNSADSSND